LNNIERLKSLKITKDEDSQRNSYGERE